MTPLTGIGVVATSAAPGFGSAQWSTIIAALIAALVAVTGYALTQAWARRDRRARAFADALAAVEEYLEAPYRVRRRQAPTAEVRAELAAAISDLQGRIAFHRAWLQVEAPAVSRAYDALVLAARAEAGTQMTEAWNTKPISSDPDMNLTIGYSHPKADAERARVIAAMRRYLRLRPFARTFPASLCPLHRAGAKQAHRQTPLMPCLRLVLPWGDRLTVAPAGPCANGAPDGPGFQHRREDP